MPNQQQSEDQQEQAKGQSKVKFPALPKAMEKRVSLKWLTMHALSNVITRFGAQLEEEPRVMLLTAWGQVEGRLNDILPSYAESFRKSPADGLYDPDLASMVTHVRSELLQTYEQEEQGLQIVDTAPILSLTEVTIRQGGIETNLPQMTLFADQVIGFTLSAFPRLHETTSLVSARNGWYHK